MKETIHKMKRQPTNSKKIELPYNPAISLLVIYLKKIETLFQKDIYIPVFTVALVTRAKIMKAT